MDNSELAILFRDLESDRVERKASDSDRNKIRQAVCAFANDLPNYRQPGVIFIGVNDDGSCSNLTITDDLLLRLVAPEVLEENDRSLTQKLASVRFTTPEPESCPTVLGLLVVGKDPQQFIPGSFVQFLRIDGTELGDPIKDQKEISGTLIDLLRMLDEVLQVNISIASDITSAAIEIQEPDYPIAALQQLTRNAILHRSYENTNAPVKVYWFNDRIEIHNPGGLYGQVNPENFGKGATDYRNPHLAEVMKNLGYVQRFGYGIPTAKRSLDKNGNPPPDFFLAQAHTLVTVRRRT